MEQQPEQAPGRQRNTKTKTPQPDAIRAGQIRRYNDKFSSRHGSFYAVLSLFHFNGLKRATVQFSDGTEMIWIIDLMPTDSLIADAADRSPVQGDEV